MTRWSGAAAGVVLLAALLSSAALADPPPPSRPLPTLEDALAQLRRQRLSPAAEILAARVAQRGPKMRLSREQAREAALALAQRLPSMVAARNLLGVMPRATVELIRAVQERGVPRDEAEAMATYLLRLAGALRLGNQARFDENHSHVIGRHWREIDYTGEGTTWQARQAHWSRLGVQDFRRAVCLHRYFVAEEKLAYFRRIYRPQGKMSAVAAP
ncbi:MAG TPA: hypothetical protein VGQ83_20715 [Polyangia bacterium]|jgi:hypothetical protein